MHVQGFGDKMLAFFKDAGSRVHIAFPGLDAKAWYDMLTGTIGTVVQEFGQCWKQDLEDVSAMLAGWCSLWQEEADDLMLESSVSLVLELCKNPNYTKLAGASALLQGMVKHISTAQKDGLSAIVPQD